MTMLVEETPEKEIEIKREDEGDLLFLVQRVDIKGGMALGSEITYEAVVDYLFDGEMYHTRCKFNADPLKEWGIIKRWDSFGKAKKFFKTDVGKVWMGYELQEQFKR